MTTPETSINARVAAARPSLSTAAAADLLERTFGCSNQLTVLPSWSDQNFRAKLSDGREAVLKISHPSERRDMLELQHEVMERLSVAPTPYRFPTSIRATDGSHISRVELASDLLFVRLLSWVDGVPFAQAKPKHLRLFEGLGHMLGTVDSALAGLDPAPVRHDFSWDLRRAADQIERHGPEVGDPHRQDLLGRLAGASAAAVSILAPELRSSLIHGDANDYNVLVTRVDGQPQQATTRVTCGLIDFGDTSESWIVAEPAIACAYAMLGVPDPVSAAGALVRGYHHVHPLSEPEIAALPHLILQRLLVSVSMSAAHAPKDPDNPYRSVSEEPAWNLLARLDGVSMDWLHFVLRGACGFEPVPGNTALVGWLRDGLVPAHPVIDLGPVDGDTFVLDLSVGSSELGRDLDNPDVLEPTRRLFGRVSGEEAKIGIGRYNEPRGWCDAPACAEPGGGTERQTIHLGIDLFAEAGTSVRSPYEAVVHSVQNNDATLDYGPTLLLEHRPERLPPFHTLYAHLAPEVLERWRPGQAVGRGDIIGEVGDMPSNGGLPPHLHFQVVGHLLGRRGEFPGEASPTHRHVWLSLCPDPNLILRIPDLEPAAQGASEDTLLHLRRQFIGPTVCVAYQRPLKIVRGFGQVLMDDLGRRYLDCVNNVAHVGHSHPRVVAAVARQMGVLNTNTRYLHDRLVEYAQRLVATLPDPLGLCFFVCSGSEANELALRMARVHTGSQDVVVVDGAYHGNTSSLVDLSPYKFSGPGGAGAPDWVHIVPKPDTYRGLHKKEDGQAGAKYAEELRIVLAEMSTMGRRPAAFFCESLLSCGGQIPLPDGYLSESVDAVRAAGGLFIADEVQVGFGRVGSHFWGFESNGVVPDIVTMGKPMGNGHPLGGVVTTREVAESFDNGMEYFNTFGGNPVSCAAGLAVLDVIRDEGLQAHALEVGEHLMAGLRELSDLFPLIGNVRGSGLFIGVELVTNRGERAPAGEHCRHLVERMRDNGILLSVDGPDHNVVKIKPPLVFDGRDADRVVETMDRILQEDAFRLPN